MIEYCYGLINLLNQLLKQRSEATTTNSQSTIVNSQSKRGFEMKKIKLGLVLMLLICLSLLQPARALADYISNSYRYAWSENGGWVNLLPAHGGGTVHETHLSGFAWGENIGWIKFGADGGGPYGNTSAADWGVNRDGSGNLSGYAWSENGGWINFNPTHGWVIYDKLLSALSGYAWSENMGWILFIGPDPGQTSQDTDGDGIPDESEWGPDGNDPNYDGNGDGIADWRQSNVASLFTWDDQGGCHCITLEVPGGQRLRYPRAVRDSNPPGWIFLFYSRWRNAGRRNHGDSLS